VITIFEMIAVKILLHDYWQKYIPTREREREREREIERGEEEGGGDGGSERKL
jgi:hypothetical protein